MDTIQILFNRDDNDCLVVLEFTTEGITHKNDLLKALRDGITRWMIETKEGKSAFNYSSGDFNIGDLLGSYAGDYGFEESLEPYMKAVKIHGIKVLFELTVHNRVAYDKVLCNTAEVDPDPV